MPGKSKKGGGLEVGSAYKMKNSALHMSAKYGSPMQANYVTPMKDRIGNFTGMTKEQMKLATAHNDAHQRGDNPHGSAAKMKSPARATQGMTDKKKTKSKDPIGNWLRAAGSQIKGDLGKLKSGIETGAQKLTSKAVSDFSDLAKTDVPKKFADAVKTKISKVKSKYADYKANRNKGESQFAYNKRKKKEATSNK